MVFYARRNSQSLLGGWFSSAAKLMQGMQGMQGSSFPRCDLLCRYVRRSERDLAVGPVNTCTPKKDEGRNYSRRTVYVTRERGAVGMDGKFDKPK